MVHGGLVGESSPLSVTDVTASRRHLDDDVTGGGRQGVPRWGPVPSSNSKLLVVSTSSRSLHMEELVGFSVAGRFRYRNLAAASIPSLFGILVYKLVTSKVASIEFSGSFSEPTMFSRWLLSLK